MLQSQQPAQPLRTKQPPQQQKQQEGEKEEEEQQPQPHQQQEEHRVNHIMTPQPHTQAANDGTLPGWQSMVWWARSSANQKA